MYIFVQCVTWGGGGIGLFGEHVQELHTACVFDQIPNLQIWFTSPKNLGGEGALER
jgi:hypothetical protein